jgi:hypothetical protein
VSDPTAEDEGRVRAQNRLRDGARQMAYEYERGLAGVEMILDMLPALCAEVQQRRATLDSLTAQACHEGLTVAAPQRVALRGPLARKVQAARDSLSGLLGA